MSKKYRQPGYQDRPDREERPRKQPRRIREGPRSPVMPGFRQVMRCATCGTKLSIALSDITTTSQCLKCQADLHSCRHCVFFDPASRFECTQPITKRIPRKDAANTCTLFEARTTVEKETTSGQPRTVDPREAFERLFKK